ncbi:MAG: ABC transporter ATP-binding protein [Firmicutes bacterium]|nr:ABC transporter ATP-binding protein [Bacillota bacterium]
MNILRIEGITKKFGGLTAVKDFNLELKDGEIVGLIGPNGAGKTTAFNMITGIYRPTSGTVWLRSPQQPKQLIDLTKLKPHVVTGLGIARTFQNIRLFAGMSVLENVMAACHLRMQASLAEAVLRLPRYRREDRQIREKALELLTALNLEDALHEPSVSLPYGKQRRLEIARALATEPRILLLDEPAAGMNPQESNELMDFIRHIRDEFKLTIFMIEHHMRVVMGVCERIKVIDHGVTIAEGNPKEIQNNEQVIKAYLGVDAGA